MERFNPKLSILQLVVSDTLALEFSQCLEAKFKVPVIITGSVGKTTVKEMIGSILSQLGSVLPAKKYE